MSDALTHNIFRTVIARSLKLAGYETSSESALDVLVDVTINKITEITREAARRASYCGRTDANAYDLIISLNEFDIPLQPLSVFFQGINKYPISTYDYLISPYPVSINTNFYKMQIQNMNNILTQKNQNHNQNQPQSNNQPYQMTADTIINDIFVPFRANTTISYYSADNIINTPMNNNSNSNNYNMNANNNNIGNIGGPILIGPNANSQSSTNNNASKTNDHIPHFFSKLPPEYTYDETPMTDSLSEGEISILEKSREDDQRESKESLAQLNKSSLSDKSYDNSEFELNLIKPPEINKPIGIYAEKKNNGFYKMEGNNPGIDPEFMPKLDKKDIDNSLQSNTKDIKSMIAILTSLHKNGKNESEPKNDD